LQTNDRPNIQTYASCTFTFSLQTFTIFSLINAFINVYYNFFGVYHIYACKYVGPVPVKYGETEQLHERHVGPNWPLAVGCRERITLISACAPPQRWTHIKSAAQRCWR